MSHIVTITTRIKDAAALAAACRRQNLPSPREGTVQLFEATATGQVVQLPGWTYPVVIDLGSGAVRFDNFAGRWGEPWHLDKLLQAYAVECASLTARRAGHAVSEQVLSDGSVKLTIRVGGGAPMSTTAQTIEVVVDPLGNVRLQTVGFAGPGCRQASAALEAALGAVKSDQPTPEFYQPIAPPQAQNLKI